MYLKTKFRKRNRLAGHKSRKYRRRRSIKRGGATQNIECSTDSEGKVCCKPTKEGLPKNNSKNKNITQDKSTIKNSLVEENATESGSNTRSPIL
jgi:hypothetical protein